MRSLPSHCTVDIHKRTIRAFDDIEEEGVHYLDGGHSVEILRFLGKQLSVSELLAHTAHSVGFPKKQKSV